MQRQVNTPGASIRNPRAKNYEDFLSKRESITSDFKFQLNDVIRKDNLFLQNQEERDQFFTL